MHFQTRRLWLKTVDVEQIRSAIRQAEQRTSGEICVSVSPLHWGNMRRAAERAFVRLGMTRTKRRNGVLFFVVPARRGLVVLGDEAIHRRVPSDFWHDIVKTVLDKFRKRDFTGGLVQGIEMVGVELAKHFPLEPGDVNELPDQVDFGSDESRR